MGSGQETDADYKKLYDDCAKKLAKAEEKIARLESEKKELLLIKKKAADAATAISTAVSSYSGKKPSLPATPSESVII